MFAGQTKGYETAVGKLYLSTQHRELPVRDEVMMTLDYPEKGRAHLNVKQGTARRGDVLKLYGAYGQTVLMKVDQDPVVMPGAIDYFAHDDVAETVVARIWSAIPPARPRRTR